MIVSPELPRAFWPKSLLDKERQRPPLIETGEFVTAMEPGLVDMPAPPPVRKGRIPAPIEGRYTPGPSFSAGGLVRGGFVWRHGQILPGSYWNLDGSLDKLVQGGILVQTQGEVNVRVPWPEAKTTTDPNPVITSENDRLNAEVERLAADNRMLVAQLNDRDGQIQGRERMIAELTNKVIHWEGEAKKAQELIAVMEGGESPRPTGTPSEEIVPEWAPALKDHGEPPRPGLVYEEETGSWIDPIVAPAIPPRLKGSTPIQNPTVEEVDK
jgi:hypothetical protein